MPLNPTRKTAYRALAAVWYVGSLTCLAIVAMLAGWHHDVFWTANDVGGVYFGVGMVTIVCIAIMPSGPCRAIRAHAWLFIMALFDLAVAFAYSWLCSLPR